MPIKSKKDAFVKMPLWWAAEAAKATRDPSMLVLVELLHRSWKAKNLTFPLPNGRLSKNGVSRKVKCRVLRDLEIAGLITIERRHGKTPLVTLTVSSIIRPCRARPKPAYPFFYRGAATDFGLSAAFSGLFNLRPGNHLGSTAPFPRHFGISESKEERHRKKIRRRPYGPLGNS
jgi:hypothetical protein